MKSSLEWLLKVGFVFGLVFLMGYFQHEDQPTEYEIENVEYFMNN